MIKEKISESTITEVAVQLLRANNKLIKREKHLRKVCGSIEGLRVDLLDPALTLLGVGQEQTVEVDAEGNERVEGECRDYYYDLYEQCRRKPRRFVSVLRHEQSQE